MKTPRLLWLFLCMLSGAVAGPSEALAQNVLRCLPSISPPTVTVGTSGTGTTGQTINMTARFACQSTAAGTKTGRLTATVAFLDNANAGIGTYLKLTTGTALIAYTFNRTTGSPVANTASGTFPSCAGAAPSQATSGAITLFSNFSVTGPGSFGIQNYFLNLCVRIPATAAGVGTYVGKLQLVTSGTIVSGGGSFQTTTNNDASVMTATVPTTCTIGALTNPTFNYTSFASTDSTFSQQLTTVSCNSGSWTIDIRDQGAPSVTTPLNGTVRGVGYVLGLSNSPTVPTSGLSALYPTAGTLNGNQTIYLQGRAAAGQAGNASCVSPCVTSRPYTVTITYN
ncbi:hypothetical protein [Hydrogenophaga sp. R2]|uniref:hypothetical protein n=1 Tax=Hydrogenophaga sp. R2 TaxID=3132827 RepID=UPI003CF11C59